ncbi:MAG: AAA family ATPase, partial [Chloroflexota bacterium]|nr:AAA family ATPase [Chloroflexota bacterium]
MMTSNGIDRPLDQDRPRDDIDEMSVPPHSAQAEEAVLGAVLKRGLCIADVVPFLKPQHFYEARHRYVYGAMAALFERAAAIDYHTIAEELERQGTYEQAGGLVYLSQVNLSTPSAAHIEHYARIVLEHAVRRRYISAGQQVAELAWNRRKDLDTVKQRAEALVLGASSDTLSRRAVMPPSEWTAHLMDYLGQARAGGLAGVSTGLRDLDTITLGLSPGLYLLAAATGTGKTAIAGQIALHVAEQHGPVVFVSMELTDVDLAVRLVSVITNIRKEKLVTGALSPEQSQEVLDAIERLSRSRLHMVFGSGYTSADVRAYALQVQATEGFKPALIVVDYIQLLRDEEGDGRMRERNVSAAARGLKDVSGELGVPVFALVQLNRNRATRIDKRPQLADLRESGDLENTADSV